MLPANRHQLRSTDTGTFDNRWKKIDVRGQLADKTVFRNTRSADNQWNGSGAFVEIAFPKQAVGAKQLAMIARVDNARRRKQAKVLRSFHDQGNIFVKKRDQREYRLRCAVAFDRQSYHGSSRSSVCTGPPDAPDECRAEIEPAMASGVPGRDDKVVAARQKADVGWHSRFLEPTVSQSVVGAHATIQLP